MPTRPRGPLQPAPHRLDWQWVLPTPHGSSALSLGSHPPASSGSVPGGTPAVSCHSPREACFGRDLGRREITQLPDQSCPAFGTRSPGKAALLPAGAAASCPARPARGLAGSSHPGRGGFALSPRAWHICWMGVKSRPLAEHHGGHGPVTFLEQGYAQPRDKSKRHSLPGKCL